MKGEYFCPKRKFAYNVLFGERRKLFLFIKLYMNIVVLVGLVDSGDE